MHVLLMVVVPMERPTNLRISESSLGSTSVELTWNAVSESPDTVRGFFTGYRVHLHSAVKSNNVSTVRVGSRFESRMWANAQRDGRPAEYR